MSDDSKLSLEELDNVAGGTYLESMEVADLLNKAGFKGIYKEKGGINFENFRSALEDIGLSVKDHGGLTRENTYTIKETGKVLNQDGAMKYLRERLAN
ncbi:MAG: hypothetical protein K6G55_04930 [Selenomonadaceae bacterium]|nr:hypothetical protein [Selenomonadaceae bacterium]